MRLFAATIVAALLPVFSNAYAASDWVAGFGYKARLIDGARQADGTLQGALEIVLEDGWKTYWRVPGESGIPPLLDFAASGNVKNVVVRWPAPLIFKDGSGTSVGYKNRVVLPLSITPETLNEKIDLNLSAFFGVCQEICVPADAKLDVQLDPASSGNAGQAIIDEAMKTVPSLKIASGFDVAEAWLSSGQDKEHVYLSLELPRGASKVMVLTEGPQDWYFHPYQTELAAVDAPFMAKIPIHRQIRTPLSGNETVRVTVIAGGKAIEKTVALR